MCIRDSHSEADEESCCHKMRLNAAELEQAVFLTLKKQMEAAVPLAPDGTLRVKASVPELSLIHICSFPFRRRSRFSARRGVRGKDRNGMGT